MADPEHNGEQPAGGASLPDHEALLAGARPQEPGELSTGEEGFVTDKDAAHFAALGREKWQNQAEFQQNKADAHYDRAKELYNQGRADLALHHERAGEAAQNRVQAAKEILETVEDDRLQVMRAKRIAEGGRDVAGPKQDAA